MYQQLVRPVYTLDLRLLRAGGRFASPDDKPEEKLNESAPRIEQFCLSVDSTAELERL